MPNVQFLENGLSKSMEAEEKRPKPPTGFRKPPPPPPPLPPLSLSLTFGGGGTSHNECTKKARTQPFGC